MTDTEVREPGSIHIWCPWCRTYIAPHTRDGVTVGNQHADLHMDVAPTAPEVEATYVLAPRYEPGDIVQDADQKPPERGTMRVLRRLDATADAVTIPAMGDKSVFEVNLEHPKKAPVYEAVFEGWLEANAPGWVDAIEDDPDTFAPWLDDMLDEWSIKRQTYDYPATRLCPRPTCPECGERLEWHDRRGAYLCPNAIEVDAIEATCDWDGFMAAVARMGEPYDPYAHGDPDELVSGVTTIGTGSCPVCGGAGHIDAVPDDLVCPNCGGEGFEEGPDGE